MQKENTTKEAEAMYALLNNAEKEKVNQMISDLIRKRYNP